MSSNKTASLHPDWNATYYELYAFPQEKGGTKAVNTLHLRGDETLLDLGCGDGKVSAKLAQKVPRGKVLGLDISPNMLAIAREHHRLPNLFFQQQSADSFETEDKFDLVVSFSALHWVKDHAAVLACTRAVLKPGGHLFFRFVSGKNPLTHAVLTREPWKSKVSCAGKFHVIHKTDYEYLLPLLGFEILSLEFLEEVTHFDTKEQLVRYFMTFLPYYAGLEEEEECWELADACASFIVEHHGVTTHIPLTTPMLSVRARLKPPLNP